MPTSDLSRILPLIDLRPIRHQVMWPDKPLDFVILPLDQSETTMHLGVTDAERVLSVVSLFFSGEGDRKQCQFRKFATLPSYQRKGHGYALTRVVWWAGGSTCITDGRTRLLRHVFRTCEQMGVRRVFCNARVVREFNQKVLHLR